MSKAKGVFYGILSSATFGLIPLFALPALKAGIGINSVLFYRFAISALFLGIVLALKRYDFRLKAKELGVLTVLGIFYGMTAILLTTSYLYIPSGIATTVHFLYPVIVTVTMILFFHERVSIPLVAAIFMAIGGVYLLSSGGSGEVINPKGIMLVLVTVFTYAFYIVGVNKSRVSDMDGLKLTFYVLLVGSVVFGLNLMLRGEALDVEMDLSTAVHLLLLAIVPTVVSDFTLVLAVQNVGSTITAVLGCMEPLTAVIMGVLVFHENLTITQVIGMAVVLIAVIVVIISNRSSKTLAQELADDILPPEEETPSDK